MSSLRNPTSETTTVEESPSHPVTNRAPSTSSPADTSPRTVGPGASAVAGAVLVATAITIGVFAGGQPTAPDTPVEVDAEQAALERLVRLGRIPAEALDPATGEEAITEHLQNRGLVPTGPTDPSSGDAARERALAGRGLVPTGPTDPSSGDAVRERALAGRGLIPSER